MSEGSRRVVRFIALIGAVALALGGMLLSEPKSATASNHRQLVPGVEYFEIRRGDTLAANVARIKPGAPVDLRPVLAHDVVGDSDPRRRWEVTSSMCRRVGGVVCINGDFAWCPRCGQPFGGVLLSGRTLRSFNGSHDELNITGGSVDVENMVWAGRMLATYKWHAEHPVADSNPLLPSAPSTPIGPREVVREIGFEGLNTDPLPEGAILYTPEWGGPTPRVGTIEVVMVTDGPVRSGHIAANLQARNLGGTGLPPGFASVIAHGNAAKALDAFWNEWHNTDADEKQLVLHTNTNRAVGHSIGGQPILLRNGHKVALNANDPKVVHRHPRTLVGYRPGGDTILMTVDGRRRGHSDGITLYEAQDLLLEQGATHGINLDGGGSSTFVAPCHGGPCVVNRPSDGTERPITVGLALVPRAGVRVASVTPAAPPPPAAIAPPETPDPASVAAAPPPPPVVPASAPAPTVDPALAALTAAGAADDAAEAARASQLRALVALPLAPPPQEVAIEAEPIEADSPLWPVFAAGALLLSTSAGAGWRVRRLRQKH